MFGFFKDMILNKLERLWRIRDLEYRMSDLAIKINFHLIEILKWDLPEDHTNLVLAIDSWICDIYFMKIKNKPFSSKRYFELLYDEPTSDEVEYIDDVIKLKFKKYRDLKAVRTNQEVLNKLRSLYTELSEDLHNRKLKTTEEYLK